MPKVEVPLTLERALDPEWLTTALAPVSGGKPVTRVEQVDLLKTTATKVRFTADCEGAPGGQYKLCIKGMLDFGKVVGGAVMINESDFYTSVKPLIDVQVPDLLVGVIDRDIPNGLIIMHDVVAQGGRFNSALDPFTPDQAAGTLEQLAKLHVRTDLLADRPWISRRVDDMARGDIVGVEEMQKLMEGPRGVGLPDQTKDAVLILKALQEVARRDAGRPEYLVHGDCHAGNTYETARGPGLIDWQLLQRGNWSLDLPYHIGAVLPVEVAEKEERNLLDHYLDAVKRLGGEVPDREEAWRLYRESVAYGYYLWAMTRYVDPAITETFVNRLGSSVTRHETFRLLGLV
jgi:hypothetical protein